MDEQFWEEPDTKHKIKGKKNLQERMFSFGGSDHSEARSPEGTREISWSQGSGATIVPQGDAVADMTHREDKLILMPGNGAGTPVGIPACHRASGVGDAGARQTSDHRAARTKRVEEDALWGPRVQV